jgi:hypothetical protein
MDDSTYYRILKIKKGNWGVNEEGKLEFAHTSEEDKKKDLDLLEEEKRQNLKENMEWLQKGADKWPHREKYAESAAQVNEDAAVNLGKLKRQLRLKKILRKLED